jgi:hypothetical protein
MQAYTRLHGSGDSRAATRRERAREKRTRPRSGIVRVLVAVAVLAGKALCAVLVGVLKQ